MKKKQDLKALTRKELIEWFEKRGYKKFRANQVFNWVYKNGVDSFDEMSNLPQDLRDKLKEEAYLSRLFLQDAVEASDGTIKYLWSLADNETIESVYLPFEDGRHSVCISSQAGCAMNCKFCATGIGGLIRNLTPAEIVDQVLEIQKDISQGEFGSPRISNVVFMGMGEPLANYESVLRAISILNDHQGLDIGMRRITLSTSGLVPQIKRLADEDLQLVLAISLNAPNNHLRDRLMPINKKYPLEKLLAAVRYYIKKTNRRVSFEYVLISGVNDSIDLAYQTVELLEGLLCHVNLIPLNPVTEFPFKRPSSRVIKNFQGVLEEKGIETTIRQERGTNIEAACGQLRRLNQ
ncbi:MAG: rRNA (adenine2503-C2)-methyltransferase [Halanaerobiales bacterium]|nr:rRNA (adenine2503-C2)-methyltransferase [Halanaerobiales bacterium]